MSAFWSCDPSTIRLVGGAGHGGAQHGMVSPSVPDAGVRRSSNGDEAADIDGFRVAAAGGGRRRAAAAVRLGAVVPRLLAPRAASEQLPSVEAVLDHFGSCR